MLINRQWFIENRDKLRKLAPLKGMCTRCTVRLARQGKKYCQRCTDYAKRYACQRKHKELWGREPTRRSQSFVSEPVRGPLPHRRDEHFADFNRARATGAAVPLRNPLPTPLGLNPFYDEIEDY